MAISQVNSFSLARLSASGHRQFSMDDAPRHRGPTALARGLAALETADLTGGDTAEPATVARGSRRRTRVDGPGRGRGRRPQRVDPNRRLFTMADSNGYQQHIVKVAVLLHDDPEHKLRYCAAHPPAPDTKLQLVAGASACSAQACECRLDYLKLAAAAGLSAREEVRPVPRRLPTHHAALAHTQ